MIAAANPENLALVRTFGFALLTLLVPALVLRATYFRGVLRRDDDPRKYWFAMACQGFLGLFLVVCSLVAA